MKFSIYEIVFMSMVRLWLIFSYWNLTLELFARFQIFVTMVSNKMWYVEPKIVNLLVDSYFQLAHWLSQYSQHWQAETSK